MRQNSLRLARLLTMLPWLQAHGPVSVKEVSRVFNISTKEVLSDLALLTFVGPEQAGGGLVDIQYDEDFVKVIDSQGLDNVISLNSYEVVALLMGLRTLKDLDLANPATFSALEKISGFQKSDAQKTHKENEINESLSNSKVLRIEYLSFGAPAATWREVEPFYVKVENSALYLRAWCRERNAWRDFRVDRILSASCTSESFERRKDLSPETTSKYNVKIIMDAHASWLLDDFALRADLSNTEQLRLELEVFSAVWFFQFLVSTATHITQLEMPMDLKSEVYSEIENTLARLKSA